MAVKCGWRNLAVGLACRRLLPLLTVGLAACPQVDTPVQLLPEPAEVVHTVLPVVHRVAGDMALVGSVTTFTRRGQRAEWTLDLRGEQVVRRFDDDYEVSSLAQALAAIDAGRNLWTVRPLPVDPSIEFRFQPLEMCLDRLNLQEQRCFVLPVAANSIPRALVADGEGDVVVLTRREEQPWQALWMRAGAHTTVVPTDLGTLMPVNNLRPRLLHSVQGARLFWVDTEGLHGLLLDEGTMAWREALFRATFRDPLSWTVASEPVRGRVWLVDCQLDRLTVDRLDGALTQPLPAPPTPACGDLAQPIQLAVSRNGDAMLVWATRPSTADAVDWHSTRWNDALGQWSADMPPWPDIHRRATVALAADDQGRFALVLQTSLPAPGPAGRTLLAAQRPGDVAWQQTLDLGPADALDEFGLNAGGDGRAVVAWAVPSAIDGGSRLQVSEVDLRGVPRPLTLTVQGQGSVQSEPDARVCTGTCDWAYGDGSQVTLRASPAADHAFAGWAGDGPCTGATTPLSFTIVGAMGCTARFDAFVTFGLTLEVQGLGRASSDPAGTRFVPGTAVRLIATPNLGQRFVGWGGHADCTDGLVVLDADRTCTAQFEVDPTLLALDVMVNGTGRVTSNPSGIDCRAGSCSARFAAGTVVTLSAEVGPDALVGWSGGSGCTGIVPSVSVVMNASASCSATFVAVAPQVGWQMLGAAPDTAAVVGRPAIATDAAGVPTIAYTIEIGEVRQLLVRRLAGTTWTLVGPGIVSNGLRSAFLPSLALDPQGLPVVAWFDALARLQVRHWDGTAWQTLADGHTVQAGSNASSPQVAVHGTEVVLAWSENRTSASAVAVQRWNLATNGPWVGGLVPGLSSQQDIDIRLALDSAGLATVVVNRYSIGTGEQPLRAMAETANGWEPLCGDVGAGNGPNSANAVYGFGVQRLADGSAVVTQTRADGRAITAWRCVDPAWLPWGPQAGVVLSVDGINTALQGMAMAAAGEATLAVRSAASNGTVLLQVYRAAAGGFESVGPILALQRRGLTGMLAVTPAAAASPIAIFGVQNGSNVGLEVHRFRP